MARLPVIILMAMNAVLQAGSARYTQYHCAQFATQSFHAHVMQKSVVDLVLAKFIDGLQALQLHVFFMVLQRSCHGSLSVAAYG